VNPHLSRTRKETAMMRFKTVALLSLVALFNPALDALAQPGGAQDPKVGIGACLASALAARAGTAVKVELKNERGTLTYEFDIRSADGSQWDIECDGATGRITEIEEEVKGPDSAKFTAKLKVSEADARRIALAAYPGTIVEIEYEIESDGKAVYEMDIKTADGKEMKVEVDASTGQIVEANQEFWQIGIE
jgi:uncharacterized membrane protein YkoI